MNESTKLEYNGKTVTKADIARMAGIEWYTVDARLKAGWSIDRIIKTPVRKLDRQKSPKVENCDTKTEQECLNCKREKCIYDELAERSKMIKMSDEAQKDFIEMVKRKRKELGWSQNKLALEACVDSKTISCLERGKHKPSHVLRDVICEALGVENVWLS